MRRITWLALAALTGLGATASPARAHPITVDGDPSDWLARAPATPNLGIVARDATERGELVWLDATGDARTDLGDPSQVDITRFAVTADATYLYFRLDVAGSLFLIDPARAPQVQIAIDLDRASGSGQTFFAAFADTVVSEDSRWEFLVRTRIEGLTPSVQVLDTSFASVGSGDIAFGVGLGGSTVEMRVPWSALGRATPAPVLRLAVTTYREDTSTGLTVPIGDSSVSNALDVISNGGDPVASAFPNSFAQELDDGVVDYWMDAWFEPDGDVYAPLAITRVMQSATGNHEFIEVRNQTGVTLDLAGYALGDEETVDAGEMMARFPAGATLAAGGTFVVTRGGSAFLAFYGRRADAEFLPTSDAMTPDMPRLTTWVTAGGSFDLGANDEALVLGPGHTILDVVTWGTGAYPGNVDLSAAPTERIAYRNPDTLDTDNGANDFTIVEDCGTSADCPSRCDACTRFACLPIPEGGACEDGDLCTTGETCDAARACLGGSAITCDDSNACTTNGCVPATGCVFTPTPAVPCDDASACTSGDACTATGTCSGTAIDCGDTNPCTADACDAISGCSHTPTPGVSCADANVCNGAEICNASGACAAGTPLACDDANPCTTNGCVPATGCSFTPATGASCDDASVCTTSDACTATGTCAGTAIGCDDGNPCTADACDAITGCSHTPTPGVSCADADLCNGAETCDASGACAAGTPLDCDDGNECTDDGCAPAFGCESVPLEGEACDDADACTIDDMCDSAGFCEGSPDPLCDDAGVPTDDGGLPLDDGGTPMDAGSSDASIPVPDAGRSDASVMRDAANDAGTDPPVAGGCGCRVGSRAEGSSALFALALLGLVVRRRRRA